MLSDCSPIPTLATSDLDRSRAFYQGLLGFKPKEEMVGGIFYSSGSGSFFVYPSTYAGTNKATSMSFELSPKEFDDVVGTLRTAGLTFDTFDAEGITWHDGVGEMGDGNEGMRSVWFSDPDGNILNVETHTHTS